MIILNTMPNKKAIKLNVSGREVENLNLLVCLFNPSIDANRASYATAIL